MDRFCASPQGLEFVIFDVLKTTKRGKPAKVVKCVKWDAPELDVSNYVKTYIDKTLLLRLRAQNRGLGYPKQLFLSHQTGLPVSVQTISRWIKEVITLAGIDTSIFLPHSTRGASTSAAGRKGATVSQILGAGDWTNLGTYQRFYERTLANTPVG